MSASTQASRARTQARKKANDDGSYFGPSPSASTVPASKRHAADKPDGEPRLKRKRVEQAPLAVPQDQDDRKSLVEFHRMPTQTLYRYLTQFDILPCVYPSPLSPDDPPPPASLTDPTPIPSRPPSPPSLTPANRPRREPTRRRSSRLLDEQAATRPPILADTVELHTVLATIVERHFRETASISGREEVDLLASFMCAVEKAKGSRSNYRGS